MNPSLLWPLDKLPAAQVALARAAGLDTSGQPGRGPVAIGDDTELDRWMHLAALASGLEVLQLQAPATDPASMLSGHGPRMVHLPQGLLAVLRCGARLEIVDPSGARHRLDRNEVCEALVAGLSDPPAGLEALLSGAGLDTTRLPVVARALRQEALRDHSLASLWLLRPAEAGSLRQVLRRQGLGRQLGWAVILQLVTFACVLGAWWCLGSAVFAGRMELTQLVAWGLLLGGTLLADLLASWSQLHLTSILSIGIKDRLFAGTLRLRADEIRAQGAGTVLARVLEAEAFEGLLLRGGLGALVSSIQLVYAGILLLSGAAWPTSLVFFSWIALVIALGLRFRRRFAAWAAARVDMTAVTIEHMNGQRTRLAQEPPALHHEGEDQALAGYTGLVRQLDRATTLLVGGVARGWLVLAVLTLLPALIAGSSATSLVAAIGGALLAHGAFDGLASGFLVLGAASVTGARLRPLLEAAERREPAGDPAVALDQRPSSERLVIEARDLSFRHQGRERAVLAGFDLQVAPHSKLLLTGASGSGKSTLAALISGLRAPSAGTLLVEGMDRHILGPTGWRDRVVLVPQFHENHVLSGTLAFNLLMGHAWPASPEDHARAEKVCRALGLGPLLEAMPGGIGQMVGESGWQLSHGERSRLYLARALLQRGKVLVLDETLGALDPTTALTCLQVVAEQAHAVILIAHP